MTQVHQPTRSDLQLEQQFTQIDGAGEISHDQLMKICILMTHALAQQHNWLALDQRGAHPALMKKIEDAHKPSWTQNFLLSSQFAGVGLVLALTVYSVAFSALGLTVTSAALATATDGLLIKGASAAGQLVGTSQQGIGQMASQHFQTHQGYTAAHDKSRDEATRQRDQQLQQAATLAYEANKAKQHILGATT